MSTRVHRNIKGCREDSQGHASARKKRLFLSCLCPPWSARTGAVEVDEVNDQCVKKLRLECDK